MSRGLRPSTWYPQRDPTTFLAERIAGRRRLSSRAIRILGYALLVILVPMAIASARYADHAVDVHPLIWYGIDLEIMRELGSRWLASGSMYLPYQMAGHYATTVQLPLANTPALYPPAAGPVFGVVGLLPWPLAVVLWWGIPLGILAYAFARWRPAPIAWALMALMFVHPATPMAFMVGGTSMWAAALVAAGLLWHWPAALLLLKPTFLPFALIGIRHRSWWITAAGVVVLTLLGPWRDYIDVARNASDIAYTLQAIPLLLVPVIAWLGSTRHFLRPELPHGRGRGVLDGGRAG